MFEIGLRGFYNFNANFTVVPIDGAGNPVVVESSSDTDDHFTGSGHMNDEVREYDFGEGMKKYYVTPDSTGTFTKVVNEDGTSVSTDILNLINSMEAAQNGGLPSYKENLINEKYKRSPKVRDFVLKGVKGFNDIFLIDGEEQWIYRIGNSKPVKLNSKEGQEIKNKLDSALKSFALENVAKIKELKEKGTSNIEESQEEQSTYKYLQDSDLEDWPKVKAWLDEHPDAKVTDIQRQFAIGYNKAQRMAKEYGLLDEDGHYIQKSGQHSDESQQAERTFAGKTLDDLDAKNGGLEALLVANKKSPVIKGTPERNGKPARMGVCEALQMADSIGKPIDKDDVARKIQAILSADSSQKAQMLADLVHDITCG